MIDQSCAEGFSRTLDFIQGARRIAISGHTSPDGDALGSALGLALAIETVFSDVQVDVLTADNAPIPRVYRFLPGSERFRPASAYDEVPDLFIMVDAPTPERIRRARPVFERARRTVAFDHHPAREEFADVVVRCVDAAATAVIVADFIESTPLAYTPEIATCLFCGLATDTGRFQYQNADPKAFAVAARLVEEGADPARIALEVYQSKSLGYIHLESVVSGRLRLAAGGRIAYSYATAEDLAENGVKVDECDGLIDLVRCVDGAETCLFLRSDSNGTVRGNLRAKGDLDVSSVAAALGGGGHVAAAGFTFEGSLDEAMSAVLPLLEGLVSSS